MKRTIIHIDEEKCNGCGLCIPNCHEGALQIIDGKARLISDLFCDGLGACLGHCPEGAISMIEREAEPYDEVKVMELMVPKGRNTILAHLEHLRDHNEQELLQQAIKYIKDNNIDMSPDAEEERAESQTPYASIAAARLASKIDNQMNGGGCGGGCPGSREIVFDIDMDKVNATPADETTVPAPAATAGSQLRQWPVQLHLLNPEAAYFREADVLLAADCTAFSIGNFHEKYLKGKTLAIACPKLDSNKESYVEKLVAMIDRSRINTMQVLVMEVPCCGGLMQLVNAARRRTGRNVPVKKTVVSSRGEVLSEEWV